MNDENWKEEYKKLKSLRPYQIKLLEEGATSLSQAWLLNSMWCEWKEIKAMTETNLPSIEVFSVGTPMDPWEG
ncbi:hypothetical protein [Prochlorococcus sp. MIT 1300]|uniref:hypothetical protein n=1 Tax=Prochlorococcus sp. MIT 1300 TaxID=3096218 RepID=UPI002A759288|nr:hypothetical protein [Prochlorococcus sp. MIT 1300]